MVRVGSCRNFGSSVIWLIWKSPATIPSPKRKASQAFNGTSYFWLSLSLSLYICIIIYNRERESEGRQYSLNPECQIFLLVLLFLCIIDGCWSSYYYCYDRSIER